MDRLKKKKFWIQQKHSISNLLNHCQHTCSRFLPAGKFDTISQTRNGKNLCFISSGKGRGIAKQYRFYFFRCCSIRLPGLKTIQASLTRSKNMIWLPSHRFSTMAWNIREPRFNRASSLFLDANPTQQQLLKRANPDCPRNCTHVVWRHGNHAPGSTRCG